jgi:hypothetical protein
LDALKTTRLRTGKLKAQCPAALHTSYARIWVTTFD